jgi:hypothetical protein
MLRGARAAAVATGLALALGATQADAQQYQSLSNGNGFYALCANARDQQGWEAAACLSYVIGLSDMAKRLSVGPAGVALCVPQGVTSGQTLDTLMAYLRDRPAERQKSTADLLLAAMAATYPCQPRR